MAAERKLAKGRKRKPKVGGPVRERESYGGTSHYEDYYDYEKERVVNSQRCGGGRRLLGKNSSDY